MGGTQRNFGVGILLSLRDSFSAGAQKAERSFGDLSGAADIHAKRIEQSMLRIKRGAMMMGIGAAMMAAAVIPIKMAAGWQESTAEIHTLISSSNAEMAGLSAEILRVSASMGQVPEVAAKAAYNIKSAGVAAAELPRVLELSGRAAVAGITDINSAAMLGTQVMNAYKFGVGDLESIYDKLFLTVREGVTTFPELSTSLGEVLATAKAARIPFDQLMASIATLTKVGVRTPQAMTSLKGLFMALQAPTSAAAKALSEVGGAEFEMAKQSGNLLRMIEILAPKIDNLAQMRKLIPELEAVKGLSALAGSLGILRETTDMMANSAGAMEEAYQKMSAMLGFQSRVMREEMRRFLITAGLPLLGALTSVFKVIIAGARHLADFAAQHKTLATVVLGLVGGLGALVFILGTVTMATALFGLAALKTSIQLHAMAASGSLTAKVLLALIGHLKFATFALKYYTVMAWNAASANVAMLGPWLLIIALAAAVAAAAYLIIKHWKPISAFFVNLWDGVKDIFSSVVNWTKNFFSGLWISMKDNFANIALAALPIIGVPLLIYRNWGRITSFFQGIWSRIVGGIQGFVNTIKGTFQKIADFFLAPFRAIWAAIQKIVDYVPNWALPAGLEKLKTAMSTAGAIGITAMASPAMASPAFRPVAPSDYRPPVVMSTTASLQREVVRERVERTDGLTARQGEELIGKLDDLRRQTLQVSSRLYLDSQQVAETVTRRQLQKVREQEPR